MIGAQAHRACGKNKELQGFGFLMLKKPQFSATARADAASKCCVCMDSLEAENPHFAAAAGAAAAGGVDGDGGPPLAVEEGGEEGGVVDPEAGAATVPLSLLHRLACGHKLLHAWCRPKEGETVSCTECLADTAYGQCVAWSYNEDKLCLTYTGVGVLAAGLHEASTSVTPVSAVWDSMQAAAAMLLGNEPARKALRDGRFYNGFTTDNYGNRALMVDKYLDDGGLRCVATKHFTRHACVSLLTICPHIFICGASCVIDDRRDADLLRSVNNVFRVAPALRIADSAPGPEKELWHADLKSIGDLATTERNKRELRPLYCMTISIYTL